MSSNDPYRDRDLVALYDLDNPGGPDHEWYRTLASDLGALRIVDLGCGTGLLTRSLATPGRAVTGIDPSATMLEFARRQSGADAVRWILGDASDLPRDGSVDLVISTGNAIMHVTRDEFPQVVADVAASVRPGGVFAFETRNPAYREWESWTPDRTRSVRETPIGRLEEWIELTADRDGVIAFDAHNLLPDGSDRVYRSVLTVHTGEEIATVLEAAGFDVQLTGGWEDGPVDASSRLLVVAAVRSSTTER